MFILLTRGYMYVTKINGRMCLDCFQELNKDYLWSVFENRDTNEYPECSDMAYDQVIEEEYYAAKQKLRIINKRSPKSIRVVHESKIDSFLEKEKNRGMLFDGIRANNVYQLYFTKFCEYVPSKAKRSNAI